MWNSTSERQVFTSKKQMSQNRERSELNYVEKTRMAANLLTSPYPGWIRVNGSKLFDITGDIANGYGFKLLDITGGIANGAWYKRTWRITHTHEGFCTERVDFETGEFAGKEVWLDDKVAAIVAAEMAWPRR